MKKSLSFFLVLISLLSFGQTSLDVLTRPGISQITQSINGSTKLAAFMPVNPFFTFTCVKSNGKYFFGAMGLEAQLRNPYVYRYNPANNTVEQEYTFTVSGADTYDIHRVPTFTEDDQKNIWMVAEELLPASGGHSTPLRVYKTSTPGDITTLTNIATISNRYAYPHIYIDRNSIVYIFARGTNSGAFIRGQYWMHKSINKGLTFSSTKIYDSGDEQKVAYFQRIHDYSDNGLYLVLNERDNDNFNYKYVAIVKSMDGGTTWTNMSGSFSKNVVSSGALTRSEMRTNCMLFENTPADNNKGVCYEGGVVKSDGTIKILLSPQTKTGNSIPTTGIEEIRLDELRFYIYSGGSWTYNNVNIPSNMTFYWAGDKPTRYINGNKNYDDLVVIDVTTRNVYKYRSTNNFASQTSTLLLNGSGHNYRMGDIPFNATNEDDYLLIIADPVGDPLIWQGEGTTNYTNLVLLRPANNP